MDSSADQAIAGEADSRGIRPAYWRSQKHSVAVGGRTGLAGSSLCQETFADRIAGKIPFRLATRRFHHMGRRSRSRFARDCARFFANNRAGPASADIEIRRCAVAGIVCLRYRHTSAHLVHCRKTCKSFATCPQDFRRCLCRSCPDRHSISCTLGDLNSCRAWKNQTARAIPALGSSPCGSPRY